MFHLRLSSADVVRLLNSINYNTFVTISSTFFNEKYYIFVKKFNLIQKGKLHMLCTLHVFSSSR